MATNLEAGTKQPVIWTDKIVIGGSSPLQTAGTVTVIETSGTSATIVTTGTLSGATLAVGAGEVGVAEVAAQFATVANGSPIAYGQGIQAGTGTLGAGSDAWITFGTGFAATPVVVVTNSKTAAKVPSIAAGSSNAGSFYVFGGGASDTITWMAIGSGRV